MVGHIVALEESSTEYMDSTVVAPKNLTWFSLAEATFAALGSIARAILLSSEATPSTWEGSRRWSVVLADCRF